MSVSTETLRSISARQTDPDKGFFAILRCYSPLQSYFDKSWRPGEIEEVV